MLNPKTLLSISVGGVLGAGLRWIIVAHLGQSSFPWAIFAINVVGSAILGCLVAELLAEKTHFQKEMITGAASGFCGSLTTFSLFAFEIADRLRNGEIFVGLIYGVMSVSLGLVAAWWGYVIRRRSHLGNESTEMTGMIEE